MTEIDSDLTTNLINLTHAASKDETRYYFMGVQIKDGRAVATDGHIMAWLDDDALKGLECFINTKTLKLFKKSHMTIGEGKVTNGQLTLPIETFNNSGHNLIGMSGPNTQELKANKDQVVDLRMSFNPELVGRLGKALLDNKRHKGLLVIPGNAPTNAIDIYVEGKRRGMLMPMRIN